MRTGRIIALVVGCLLLLPGIGMLFGGGALGVAAAVQRDDDGYFDVTIDRVESPTVAVTTDDLLFEADPASPGWLLDALDIDVRLRATNATSGEEVFVGIAARDDLDDYLAGVAHDVVVDLDEGLEPVYRTRTGTSVVDPPTEQTFWVAGADGPGRQELTWEATSGRWAAVVMNADGSPGVAADVDVGASAGFIVPLAWLLGGVGAVLTIAAVALIITGARGERDARTPTPGTPDGDGEGQASAAGQDGRTDAYPVQLEAELDPDLSRWQWLVKWFLAIPHVIVLAVLWIAFVVLTIVAGVAILFTGRYPRGIFDFNVGVLRWSWRVSYYASTGGLGTDRYPPFSLRPEPDDLARLDVAYPQRLTNWMVLVKWFLAIPHLVIVALLAGAPVGWISDGGERFGFDLGGGLLGLLVLVAAIVLLFAGNYPRSLFDLIIGFNRWIYRVIAYVALMTDDYPPFRLDQGGAEPTPPPPPHSGGPLPTPRVDDVRRDASEPEDAVR